MPQTNSVNNAKCKSSCQYKILTFTIIKETNYSKYTLKVTEDWFQLRS